MGHRVPRGCLAARVRLTAASPPPTKMCPRPPAPAFGGDICSALEITAVGRALARLDDDDKASLRRSDTGGLTPGIWEQIDPRVQSVVLVTENRATDLILQWRKPGAGPPS